VPTGPRTSCGAGSGCGGAGLLVELNERKPEQGIAVLKQINLWDPLIEQLPRGGGHRDTRHAMDQIRDLAARRSLRSLEAHTRLYFLTSRHRAGRALAYRCCRAPQDRVGRELGQALADLGVRRRVRVGDRDDPRCRVGA
jgi:hypothetical protein